MNFCSLQGIFHANMKANTNLQFIVKYLCWCSEMNVLHNYTYTAVVDLYLNDIQYYCDSDHHPVLVTGGVCFFMAKAYNQRQL